MSEVAGKILASAGQRAAQAEDAGDPRVIKWETERVRPLIWLNLGEGRFQLRKEWCAPEVSVFLEPERKRHPHQKVARYTIEIEKDGKRYIVTKPSSRKSRYVSLATAKFQGRFYGTGRFRAIY